MPPPSQSRTPHRGPSQDLPQHPARNPHPAQPAPPEPTNHTLNQNQPILRGSVPIYCVYEKESGDQWIRLPPGHTAILVPTGSRATIELPVAGTHPIAVQEYGQGQPTWADYFQPGPGQPALRMEFEQSQGNPPPPSRTSNKVDNDRGLGQGVQDNAREKAPRASTHEGSPEGAQGLLSRSPVQASSPAYNGPVSPDMSQIKRDSTAQGKYKGPGPWKEIYIPPVLKTPSSKKNRPDICPVVEDAATGAFLERSYAETATVPPRGAPSQATPQQDATVVLIDAQGNVLQYPYHTKHPPIRIERVKTGAACGHFSLQPTR